MIIKILSPPNAKRKKNTHAFSVYFRNIFLYFSLCIRNVSNAFSGLIWNFSIDIIYIESERIRRFVCVRRVLVRQGADNDDLMKSISHFKRHFLLLLFGFIQINKCDQERIYNPESFISRGMFADYAERQNSTHERFINLSNFTKRLLDPICLLIRSDWWHFKSIFHQEPMWQSLIY